MQKLTHEERERSLELERRIRAAGVPIVKATQDETPELQIRQNFEAFDSVLFEYSGGIGIVLPLEVVSNMTICVFSDVDIRLDHLPSIWFHLLGEREGGAWPHYCFYERPEMRFDRGEVINHLVAQQVRVYRGNPIRGLLLASSMDPVPPDILPGLILDGAITIVDQFERKHHAKIRVRVDGALGKSSSRQLSNLKARGRLLDQLDRPSK